jgi:hypothetical protein
MKDPTLNADKENMALIERDRDNKEHVSYPHVSAKTMLSVFVI